MIDGITIVERLKIAYDKGAQLEKINICISIILMCFLIDIQNIVKFVASLIGDRNRIIQSLGGAFNIGAIPMLIIALGISYGLYSIIQAVVRMLSYEDASVKLTEHLGEGQLPYKITDEQANIVIKFIERHKFTEANTLLLFLCIVVVIVIY